MNRLETVAAILHGIHSSAERVRTMGGRTISGRNASSTGPKQQMFGRVDLFCLFAVLPILVVAVVFFLGGIAILGVGLIALALLIVVFDSWANRPIKKSAARYRDNSDRPSGVTYTESHRSR